MCRAIEQQKSRMETAAIGPCAVTTFASAAPPSRHDVRRQRAGASRMDDWRRKPHWTTIAGGAVVPTSAAARRLPMSKTVQSKARGVCENRRIFGDRYTKNNRYNQKRQPGAQRREPRLKSRKIQSGPQTDFRFPPLLDILKTASRLQT